MFPGWRQGTVLPAQDQPDGDQCKDGDAEIVVHSGKKSLANCNGFPFFGRVDCFGHAFAEDKLRENKRRDQPVQADLLDRVSSDAAEMVSFHGHCRFLL